jgi:hypothetical protein
MYKIAISGRANSGKDTTSRYFEDCFNSGWKDKYFTSRNTVTIAFADPIKEMILQMYPGLKREYLFGDSEYRKKIIPGSYYNGESLTIRALLQELGEGCKKYNPKIWIDAFDEKCKIIQTQSKGIELIIASDLRFIDEFNYLKENGFYMIRILRGEDEGMNHVSETQQKQIKNSDFDKIIDNNGSLADLKAQIDEIAKFLKE